MPASISVWHSRWIVCLGQPSPAFSSVGVGAVLSLQSSAHFSAERPRRCQLLDARAAHGQGWMLRSSPSVPVDGVALVTLGEFTAAAIGGHTGDDNLAQVQLYDARADRWSVRAEWQLPVMARYHCAAVLEP